MILPPSYVFTLALILAGMLCWGSWASLYKATGKLRFELFYFDFMFGLVVAALLFAFTLGSMGFDGFSFMDDVLHAGKKQDLIGAIAGGVFNLGNMLLLAAVAEAGMAVAFPVGIGVAIVVGSTWRFFLTGGENAVVWLAGALVVAAGVGVAGAAYRLYRLSRVDELVRTGQQKTTRRTANTRGIPIAVFAGLILGSYFPLVTKAMDPEIGVGPYSMGVMFAVGVFASTFLFNLFFMNLPISGQPLEIFEYFKVSRRDHLYGFLAGVLWLVGFDGSLVAGAAEGKATVGPAISYGLLQGAVVIAAIWGLTVWKEYKEADARIRSLLMVMLALFVCGIGLIAVAPTVGHG
jgi:glucose uptake protein